YMKNITFYVRPFATQEISVVLEDNEWAPFQERIDNGESIDFQWFETAPKIPLLGKMIVLVRPKKVLDEEFTKDAWQIDE
ncbi:MAG: RuBisCO accumulation factor 1, partial [Dolichospermum sp.]